MIKRHTYAAGPAQGESPGENKASHLKLVIACIVVGLLALLNTKGLAGGENETGAGVNQHRQVQTHASRYAIHDTRLRETMLRLNTLVSYSEQPGSPLTKENRDFLQGLIDTVAAVAESAEFLKQEKKIDHLGDEQMAIYRDLADKLYIEAVSIDLNAKKMKLEEMNEAFLNLNQTCIKCHSLFRSL